MSDDPQYPRFRIRVQFRPGGMLGPGKAELLERICETGSIAAAGREMGMSYKRAWLLVETMNELFREPLVESTRGGAKGGGAVVTDAGIAVLEAYRNLEENARRASKPELEHLVSMLSDERPDP